MFFCRDGFCASFVLRFLCFKRGCSTVSLDEWLLEGFCASGPVPCQTFWGEGPVINELIDG